MRFFSCDLFLFLLLFRGSQREHHQHARRNAEPDQDLALDVLVSIRLADAARGIAADAAALHPAIAAVFPEIPAALHQGQIRVGQHHILAFCDSFAQLFVDLIDRITAGHLHIIVPVPAETRDEKQVQRQEGHVDLIPSVATAFCAYRRLGKIKFLLSAADFHQKEHTNCLSALQAQRITVFGSMTIFTII